MQAAIIETKTQAPAPRTKEGLKASLCSLTRRLGDQRNYRDSNNLRSILEKAGPATDVRRALEAIKAGPAKAEARDFAVLLGKLSLHYWTPDFTPEQAKHRYSDFIRLLDGCTADELRDACDEWLMDPLNRRFPTPGQLRELMKDRLRDRNLMARGAEELLELLDAGDRGEMQFDIKDRLQELARKMKAKC